MPTLTPNLLATFVLGLLCVTLVVAMWSDVKSHRIPNGLVFSGALMGLLLNSMLPEGFGFASQLPGALGFLDALIGLTLGLGILLPFYMLRVLGAGDVKLMAMVGAFIGPNAIVNTVIITFIAGGLLALMIAIKKNVFREMIYNVQQMAIGSYFKLALHEMPRVDGAPVTAAKMPYAIAIGVGTFTYILLAKQGHMPLLTVM